MARSPRRTREHVLETEGENHLRSLIPSSWIIERSQHDYGIDLQVEIVKGEEVTGVRFSIQLKSTDNIKIRKKAYIAHECQTNALCYYLDRPEPVIYLVYDAVGHQAYWVWIQDFIRNELRNGWRSKKEVTVRLPKGNVFDDRAIRHIEDRAMNIHSQARWLQAVQTSNNPHYSYSIAVDEKNITVGISPRSPGATVAKPITLNGKFIFDQSPEGLSALEAFQTSMKTGTPVKIDSRFFEGFDLTTSFPDLFAHIDWMEIESIELLPIPSESKIKVTLQALDEKSNVLGEINYVELRVVQSGSEEITLSNEQQGIPLRIRQVVNKISNRLSMNFAMELEGQYVSQLKMYFDICQAIIHATYVRFLDIVTGQSMRSALSTKDFPELDQRFISIIDDLYLIQQQINIPLIWSGSLTIAEARVVKQVAHALRYGYYEENMSGITIVVDKPSALGVLAAYRENENIQLALTSDNISVVILGREMSLGYARIIFPKVLLSDSSLSILKSLDSEPDNISVTLDFKPETPGRVQLNTPLPITVKE